MCFLLFRKHFLLKWFVFLLSADTFTKRLLFQCRDPGIQKDRKEELCQANRAIFKWLPKIATATLSDWFIKYPASWVSQPMRGKTNRSLYTRFFPLVLSKLRVVARNFDWFIALFALLAIGRSNCLCIGFSTVIWKPLQPSSPSCWIGSGWRSSADET